MVRAAHAQGWRVGEQADAKALTADARGGDAIATAVIAAGTRALASAFLSTAALFDLTDIVVGGGVASAGDVLMDPLRRAYAEFAVYPHLPTCASRRRPCRAVRAWSAPAGSAGRARGLTGGATSLRGQRRSGSTWRPSRRSADRVEKPA